MVGLLLVLVFAGSGNAAKLIFLDCDGVLNHAKSDDTQLYVTEDEQLVLLSRIIKATGASIVLNSTWRYARNSRDEFKNRIESFNTRFEKKNEYVPLPISYTPNFGSSTSMPQSGRPEEILWWLQENTNFYGDMIHDTGFMNRWNLMVSKYPDEFPKALIETFAGGKKLDVTDWVAIDDLDFATEIPAYPEMMKGHFVQTDKKVGLTRANAKEVIALLRGDTRIKLPK